MLIHDPKVQFFLALCSISYTLLVISGIMCRCARISLAGNSKLFWKKNSMTFVALCLHIFCFSMTVFMFATTLYVIEVKAHATQIPFRTKPIFWIHMVFCTLFIWTFVKAAIKNGTRTRVHHKRLVKYNIVLFACVAITGIIMIS
jgi:hypothetical protein